MPQDTRHIRSYDYDVPDDGPGRDIVSLPESVQRMMDAAAERIREGDVPQGLSMMHEAGVELARTEPLVFAGLMAAQMGVTGMRAVRRGGNRTTIDTENFVFGIRTGHSQQTTTDEFFEERSVDFGSFRPSGNGSGRW